MSYPTYNYLYGAAALSANDVWAAGAYRSDSTQSGETLIEHWDGGLWRIVPSANAGQVSELRGMSAVSPNDVWAVGYSDLGTLIEHWNGAQWSIVPSPNGSAGYNSLQSVSALSANDAWAVGSYDNGSGTPSHVLIEHWNGTQWQLVPGPSELAGGQGQGLKSVAALAANDVWAVGTLSSALALTIHWNGSQWSVISSPNPGEGGNYLLSVSAGSANDVWAVGAYTSSSGASSTFTMHWNGTQWDVVSSPNIGLGPIFQAVDVISSNDIWAVGNYLPPSSDDRQTLTEHWDGTEWTIVPSPNAFTLGENIFRAVVGISHDDVWAIGDYINSVQRNNTLAVLFSCPIGSGTATPTATPTVCGLAWRQVANPNPVADQVSLSGIQAISSSDIWAVGTYYVSGSPNQILKMHWDGVSWSIVADPVAGGLRGIAALSSSDVWTVGGTTNQMLIQHWNGSTWTTVPGPDPGAGTSSSLSDVTAVSPNDIWAVGVVSASAEDYNQLIIHWNGSTWTQVESPATYQGRLSGVFGVSANDIWAVGEHRPTRNPYEALIMHWDGTEWSIVSNPALDESHLYAVRGSSANDIWAVGTTSFGDLTLTMHWNGTAWSVVGSPNAGSQSNYLLGIAALAPDNAWAVGAGLVGGVTPRAVILHWNGTAWSVVSSPNPGSGNQLLSVTAVSHQDVWSAGSTGCSGCLTQGLIERYSDPCVTPLPTATPTRTTTPISTPTASATPCAVSFSDVQTTDYFYEAVRYLYCRGAISGYSDGTFRPYANTTRGQLSKIVVLSEGWTLVTPSGTPTFRDVPSDSAFYAYVETAYAHQIISGYSCGSGCLEFRPGNNVTRAQLTKIIVLAQNWTVILPQQPTFRDVSVGDPFFGYVETAYAHQIISGYACGTGCLEFRAGNNATRGQISKIVYNAVTNPQHNLVQ